MIKLRKMNRDNLGRFEKEHIPWNKEKKYKNLKQSERMKGNKINLNKKNALGYKHTVDAKEKIRNSKLGSKNPNYKKKPWNYIDGRRKLLSPGRYGDDWDKIRYLVYSRDHFTCQECGTQGKRLDVHHKIPFLISFDNSLSNLIALCCSCHMKEDARIMKELKAKAGERKKCIKK